MLYCKPTGDKSMLFLCYEKTTEADSTQNGNDNKL